MSRDASNLDEYKTYKRKALEERSNGSYKERRRRTNAFFDRKLSSVVSSKTSIKYSYWQQTLGADFLKEPIITKSSESLVYNIIQGASIVDQCTATSINPIALDINIDIHTTKPMETYDAAFITFVLVQQTTEADVPPLLADSPLSAVNQSTRNTITILRTVTVKVTTAYSHASCSLKVKEGELAKIFMENVALCGQNVNDGDILLWTYWYVPKQKNTQDINRLYVRARSRLTYTN